MSTQAPSGLLIDPPHPPPATDSVSGAAAAELAKTRNPAANTSFLNISALESPRGLRAPGGLIHSNLRAMAAESGCRRSRTEIQQIRQLGGPESGLSLDKAAKIQTEVCLKDDNDCFPRSGRTNTKIAKSTVGSTSALQARTRRPGLLRAQQGTALPARPRPREGVHRAARQ